MCLGSDYIYISIASDIYKYFEFIGNKMGIRNRKKTINDTVIYIINPAGSSYINYNINDIDHDIGVFKKGLWGLKRQVDLEAWKCKKKVVNG